MLRAAKGLLEAGAERCAALVDEGRKAAEN